MKTLKTVLIFLLVSTVVAQANTIADYGDHEGATVWYRNVEEDTQVGKYGAPTVSTAADYMTFTPLGMYAAADNGSSDINNAHLLFDVIAKPSNQVTDLNFFEQGDFTMSGGTSDDTYVDITATFQVLVHEYTDANGVIQTPFFPLPVFYDMVFSANSDGTFEYLTDGLGAEPYQSTWTGSLGIDIANVHLPAVGIFGAQGANSLTVSLDNIETASSEIGSSSEIYKKFAGGFTVSSETIPEPASVVLIAATTSLMIFVRRRFFI
jgi:hypothetical protein